PIPHQARTRRRCRQLPGAKPTTPGHLVSPGRGQARCRRMNPRRRIPPVARLLAAPGGVALTARYRRERVVDTLRLVLGELRRQASDGGPVPPDEARPAGAARRLESASRPRLTRVVNATGVVLHTNLGRAPLADEAIAALVSAAGGATNLELDLGTGRRGERDDLVVEDLSALTGAEAALVAYHQAAAVPLGLDAL